ncbi:MAG: 8-oxo-dGTP diphosphatase [Cellvibrionaceae bacterium]|jgi:8-oxo-dGTP diphosphatase
MNDSELVDFLKSYEPIFSETDAWRKGLVQLEINYYLSDKIPPVDTIMSVRAMVFKGDEILTIEEAENEFHILPGGRREEGESLEETVHREVAEETGWTIRDLKLFGFVHLKHTSPKPKNFRHRYPHFVWLIYTARAADYRPEKMFSAEQLADEYVISSKFILARQASETLSERDQILIKASENSK